MRHDSQVETARGRIPLSEVRVGDMVLTHRGRYRRVEAVHDQGTLPILRITTHSGRVTHAAPTHPYLTPRGWVEASELQIGDVLAVVNRGEDRPGADGLSPEAARFLGYLVGDGSVTHSMASFVNADREVIDDFCLCAGDMGFETSISRRKSHWQVRVKGGERVRAYLRSHGLQGCSSYTKRIPPAILNGNREALANFIGAYWTCDGGFDVRPISARGSKFRAYGTTVSAGLAEDLVYALGMLGIESRLRPKARKLETAAQPGGVYRSFSIEVQRESMTAMFADIPGLCSAKRALAAQCQRSFEQTLWDDPIVEIAESGHAWCLCLTVEEDHSFVCSGIAVKNSMKSLIVSVFWQAWVWGPCGLAHWRVLTTAFSDIPVNRDNYKIAQLLKSQWFQVHWPLKFNNVANGTIRNQGMGERLSAPMGSVTGLRGDIFAFDDPHSTTSAESDKQRADTITQFREGILNRTNDPETSIIVVIMQRLHANDVSGVILRELHGWIHLMLPMEFEPERRCKTPIFEDPRTFEGELLDYARWTQETWEAFKKDTTAYALAGQYQQRPTSREGNMFKRAWFADKRIRVAPFGTRWVRHWDLAATAANREANPAAVGTGARTAGVKMGRTPDGRFIVADSKLLREEGYTVKDTIKSTAQGERTVEISLPQDPGQAGKVQKSDFIKFLAGFRIHVEAETGEKADRARPFADQCEGGNVYLLDPSLGTNDPPPAWIEPYLDELCDFPTGKLKDQVDASSGAFGRLVQGQARTTALPIVVTAQRTDPTAHPENIAPRG